jgi:hypothetical protein
MEGISRGEVEVKNPFNKKVFSVSLKPDEVAAFVFWSKNFRPFIDKLAILEKAGFDKFLFNFTITGLPREIFEPDIPPAEATIPDFIALSRRYGKKAVFWRYDPLIFSDITDENFFLEQFKRLSDRLAPYTERVIFSFACFYHKVKRSLNELRARKNINVWDESIERKKGLAGKIASIAADYGLKFQSCCCDYLLDVPGVTKAHCVDGALVSELWDFKYEFGEHPSRNGCGCHESIDIGEYGTCKGGCVYCYAGK